MTLDEGKNLLSENGISYEMCEFENEAAYWRHTSLFPYTKYARDCKVIALTILSKNGKKNIELQFNAVEHDFVFEELRFGGFGFEMFDYNQDMLADDLMDRIKEIQSGNFAVIIANDLKNRRWLGDSCFDLNEDDDVFGADGFKEMMKRIHQPKRLLSRIFRIQKQYEVYDWSMYQCIVK